MRDNPAIVGSALAGGGKASEGRPGPAQIDQHCSEEWAAGVAAKERGGGGANQLHLTRRRSPRYPWTTPNNSRRQLVHREPIATTTTVNSFATYLLSSFERRVALCIVSYCEVIDRLEKSSKM